MADSNSKSIGGIIRFRNFFKAENSFNHFLHLHFFSSAITCNSLFYLNWCITFNNKIMLFSG